MNAKTPHNGGASNTHPQDTCPPAPRTIEQLLEALGPGATLGDLVTAQRRMREAAANPNLVDAAVSRARSAASATTPRIDEPEPQLLAFQQATRDDSETATATAILEIFHEHGPLVDDDLYENYVDAGYPRRSPQRIRTVRAGLVKAGKVRRAGRGHSIYGNPATLWERVHQANGDLGTSGNDSGAR